MKKLILALLLSLSSILAMAKDGPFPLASVIGVWANGGDGSRLSIQAVPYSVGKSLVLAMVTDVHGRPTAQGASVHEMASPSLDIAMKYVDGHFGALHARSSEDPKSADVPNVAPQVQIFLKSNDGVLSFGRLP